MNKKWSYKEIIWLIFALIVVSVSSVISGAHWMQIVSSIAGVIYVILIAKQEKIAYLFGIVNVIFYGVILFKCQLYGSAIYNLCYTIPFLIYGYIVWNKLQKQNEQYKIKRMNRKQLEIWLLSSVALVCVYCIIASYFNMSDYVIDAITVCIGAIGTYFMTNKYIEQWYAWLIVNSISLFYWTSQTIVDIKNLPLAIMWAIYVSNSAIGLVKWHKVKIK